MSLKNFWKCCAGFLCLGLGAIGVVLPVWPTTPFLLVSAACFASTPKIYKAVLKIPFFNEYIRSYREKQGLRPRTVVISLSFLWGMLALSMFHLQTAWAVILLSLVGTAVTIHILMIAKPKSYKSPALRGHTGTLERDFEERKDGV